MRALSQRGGVDGGPGPSTRDRRNGTTLEEVARLAGVSRATVSRVVNGSPKVSPDVRRDVQAAIDRARATSPTGPPGASSPAAATRSRVVITEPTGRLFSDPFFPRLLRGISSELAARDLQLDPAHARHPIADERRTADYLTAGHVDGALLVSLHGDDPLPARLAAAGIPIVLVGRPPQGRHGELRRRRQPAGRRSRRRPPHRRRPAGRRDHRRAAGHGRRRRPARRATATRSPTPASPPTRASRRSATSPRRAAPRRWSRLLAARPDIDAVFAASDLMAAGAMAVLAAAGRRVPADVAVVGFDDSPVATTTTPAAHQRPTTDRGDGPRDGPPACRCRRGLRSRAPARDPGHRTGTARIERREAVALSRPATGGRSGPMPGPSQPLQPPLRWEIDRSRHEEEIPGCNRLDPGPRALIALLGVIAIVASACGGATTSTAPSAAATAAAERRGSRDAPPRRRPSPRRRSSRTRPAPTAASSSAGSSASAPARSPQQIEAEAGLRRQVQRVAEGRLHRRSRSTNNNVAAQKLKTQHRRRQRAGHHRAGRRRGPEPLPRQPARPGAAHRQDRLQRRPASTPSWSTSSSSARTAPRSASRTPSIRRTCTINKDLFDEARPALPADQGRRPVRGQAVGHGRASAPSA